MPKDNPNGRGGKAVEHERALAFVARLKMDRTEAERKDTVPAIDREALGQRLMAWLEAHQDLDQWTKTQVKHVSVLIEVLEASSNDHS